MKLKNKKSSKQPFKPSLTSSNQSSPQVVDFDSPVYFYLVKSPNPVNLPADFESIFTYLGSYGDIKLDRLTDTSLSFSYPESLKTATIKIAPPDRMVLTSEKSDNISVHVINNVVKNIGYRIFNPTTEAYMVSDPYLVDLTTVRLEPHYFDIFNRYHLTPLYQFRNSQVFFAKDSQTGYLHMVNRHLLEHLLEHPSDTSAHDDFSLKVAKSIGHFVALFDRGLIPISFYDTFNHPTPIVNLSGFNLTSLEMAVFASPQVFEYDSQKQSFISLSTEAARPRKDSLKKGDSLNDYISAYTSKVVGPDRLIAAKIAKDVAYDHISPGIVIPRLNISVFIDSGK